MDLVVQTSKQTLPATTGKRLLDALSGVEWSPRHDRFLDLAATIDPAEIALRRVYTRQSPDIFYLELRRRGAVAA